jgi:hypothetical protein
MIKINLLRPKMCEIINIEANEPHINFYCPNRIHIVPISVIKNIADGKTEITQLDGWKEITRLCFGELLKSYIFPYN